MADFNKLIELLVEGEDDDLCEETKKLLCNNISASEILSEGLIKGMDVVGKKFEEGDLFLPEMLAAANSMKEAMQIIKPLLSEGETGKKGKIVFATVEGDVHDIGKNLCITMLEGAGFEVIDMGIDIKTEDIIAEVEKEKPQILCLSALLALTMPPMRDVIEGLKNRGLRDYVKVFIGGAPITQGYADEIGADGYSDDASGCVKLAKNLLG